MADGYLGNHFLVSMPQMADDNFARTVTLICQHDENGALGIVINRLSSHTLGEIYQQLEIEIADRQSAAQPVFEGGPVHREFGLVVHSSAPGHQWESTLPIGNALALTSSKDILVDMARGAGPERALMSLGYAGWGPGQLEQEILQNAWFSTPVEQQILFDTRVDEKWNHAAGLIGMDLNKLTGQVGHA
jgi:putative transcriptional regulator